MVWNPSFFLYDLYKCRKQYYKSVNGHTCITDVTCENNIKVERWRYIATEYLYAIETNLAFKLGGYKLLIVITKVSTKKITKKIYRKGIKTVRYTTHTHTHQTDPDRSKLKGILQNDCYIPFRSVKVMKGKD